MITEKGQRNKINKCMHSNSYGGILVFPLCYSTMQQNFCTHGLNS